MIREYLNFSKKIKIISNSIPIFKDLKKNIWKYYKKYSYANRINILINNYLVKMNTEIKCDDCGKMVKYKNLIRTYCTAEGFWYGCTDEYKLICKDGCEFNLDCGCLFKSKYYNHENKYLECFCSKCNKNSIKKLYWKGKNIYDFVHN